MHVEIDRETDPAALARHGRKPAARARRRPRGRRGLAPDARRRALRAGRRAGHRRRRLDRRGGAPRPSALLRWLVDDHFTFLGYREYDLVERGRGRGARRPCRAPAWGAALRPAAGRGPSPTCPRDARRKAREPRLLILTKANCRSTVHRPAYLDYVGVKRSTPTAPSWASGASSGCSPPSAYTQSRLAHPGSAPAGREVLEPRASGDGRTAARTCCSSWRPTRATSCSRCERGDLLEVATAVLHLQERRQTRLFLRRDDYGRFMSCLVYLPRDRYTTDVRLPIEQILREALRRGVARTTPPGSRSRCSPGCTSSSGCRPGEPRARRRPRAARAAARRGHPRRGTTTSRMRFSTSAARRSGATPQGLRRRLPGGLQGGLPRPHRRRRRAP